MLIPAKSNDVKSLFIEGQPIEVVISEDGASPLSLVMPPYEDMAEIKALQGQHFSIKEWSLVAQAPMVEMLGFARARLLKKYEKYSRSPTYLNRMANLASIAGDFVEEEKYLREASGLTRDDFISNRLIENLIARHRQDEAEILLATKDLTKSLYANLRLAAMYALRSEISQATERVAAALEIDPLDFGARLFDGALKLWGGDYERAILSFRIASERRPNSAALHTNMAVAYVRTNRQDKALQCLKMAVAIDPLSLNAVTFLADIAYAINRNEDAVPSLRYFIRYEQKNSSVWARLARALLRIGETSEAIAAIKRQASLEDHSEVWNNLGIAYHVKGDAQNSIKSFKHAMELSSTIDEYGFCAAARNAAALISRTHPPEQVIKFIDEVLRPENEKIFATGRDLATIFIIKLQSMVKARKIKESARFGEELMAWDQATPELVSRVATFLLSLYSLNEGGASRALQIAKEFSELALHGKFQYLETRPQLLNNIAFVLAEHGEIKEAERHLQAISSEIHKNPYPTATSGLLHLKKGNLERADQLYSEALRLCVSSEDKNRIKQKWNLEIGKVLIASEPKKALRFLSRARDSAEGEEGIAVQAVALIKSITTPGVFGP